MKKLLENLEIQKAKNCLCQKNWLIQKKAAKKWEFI